HPLLDRSPGGRENAALARVLQLRVQDPCVLPQIWRDPLLLLGVDEEEVLLLAIGQLREPDGEADHDLLHAAGDPGPQAGVDADAQRAHPPTGVTREARPRARR